MVMAVSDYIALGTLAILVLSSFAGILAWALNRYDSLEKERQAVEKKAVIDSLETLNKAQEKTSERLERWEQTQNNQIQASMKQFMNLEVSIKDYAHQISVLSIKTQDIARDTEIQYKRVSEEIDRLWKTVVKEIAPGVFRVSEGKEKK